MFYNPTNNPGWYPFITGGKSKCQRGEMPLAQGTRLESAQETKPSPASTPTSHQFTGWHPSHQRQAIITGQCVSCVLENMQTPLQRGALERNLALELECSEFKFQLCLLPAV